MNWLEVHIDTNHAGLDPVETMLSSLDVDGVVIDDETEFREFLENNRQYWDYVDEDLSRRMEGLSRVTFYLQADEEGFAKLGRVRLALEDLRSQGQDWGSLIMSLDNLADEDWENNWKAFYKPMEIGERLIVVPDWEQAETGDRVELRLNPGLAFGTGSHATTRLCLTALEKIVAPGMKVLEFAFSGPDNAYLPHHYRPGCICYTGTHDNDTSTGWYQNTSDYAKDKVRRYMNTDASSISWDFIRICLGTIARYAIFPLQDVLKLGSEARMNTPGVPLGNWEWRYRREDLNSGMASGLRQMTELFGR